MTVNVSGSQLQTGGTHRQTPHWQVFGTHTKLTWVIIWVVMFGYGLFRQNCPSKPKNIGQAFVLPLPILKIRQVFSK